tara:strand:- start:64 stop:333 length:270 start_codon:yes stop_codon:yes gene_type:complete
MIEYDNKSTRLQKRLKGLGRAIAGLDELYLYGVYPQNYPHLSIVVEECKDHLKRAAKDTKFEITELEEPNAKYDLTDKDTLEVIQDHDE